MEKLIFEPKILNILRTQHQAVLRAYPDTQINDDFFYYHNTQCPRCLRSFKVYNRSIKEIYTVSVFVEPEQNRAFTYGLCKTCAKSVLTQTVRVNNSDTIQVEDIILKTLGLKS